MNEQFVVVVDALKARFFTLQPTPEPEFESGPNLIEVTELNNINRGLNGQQWSSLKTGRNRVPGGGPAHGYDDHRTKHMQEYEKKFAREISEEVVKAARQNHCKRVIITAGRQMLGHLRYYYDLLAKAGIEITELDKDLIKLSAQEIHHYLSREGMLPARKSPVHLGLM